MCSPVDSGSGASAREDGPADSLLITQAQAGNKAALGRLLQRHERRITNHCTLIVRDPEVARDMAQETMLKIMKGLAQFDGRSLFTTWATAILLNVCRSYHRAQKLRQHQSLDVSEAYGNDKDSDGSSRGSQTAGAVEPQPLSRIESAADQRRMRVALDLVNAEQRELLVLAHVHNHSYQEIGVVLAIPEGTVKSRLFRARAALQEQFERLESGSKGDGNWGTKGGGVSEVAAGL